MEETEGAQGRTGGKRKRAQLEVVAPVEEGQIGGGGVQIGGGVKIGAEV